MWRCSKYLELNMVAWRECVEGNNRCFNCLLRHKIANCTSFRTWSHCKERHNHTLCPNANASRLENNYKFKKIENNPDAMGNNNAHSSVTSRNTPGATSS